MTIPALEPASVFTTNSVSYPHGCSGILQAPPRSKISGQRMGLGMARPAGIEMPSGVIFGKESIY